MNLVLVGYMASGKSTIGKKLAKIMGYEFIDLDNYIETREHLSIPEIFKTKGEIHFRKLEQVYLKELTTTINKSIISLGGGTPCFYDTITWLNAIENVTTIYLKTNIDVLVNRLYKDTSRPLISHIKSKIELKDFIAKHLFERSFFYNQANIVIDSADSEEETINNIIFKLI
ncbi:shikimate kinase [Olleya aquimaris]|uniref:Shikimate kinase n=1 Tax=Olleya aquimaris TaxID=639310 RepID=A0A327RAF1_9FLAO|nr:shikimate kinase [Olleya aquimaris]RAJ12932.1 shikimate kinase [Olleya aquimaris]